MSAKRIIINSVVTYGRSLLGVALTLFSGRWVLQALGARDLGLYSVVGALITFVSFLNIALSTAFARFFAFSIGKGDVRETREWFNTALSLYVLLAVLFLAIGWPAGEWAVRRFVNIPPDRLETCVWLFRFSIAATVLNMVAAPYIGMHTAKQNIAELNVWSMLAAVGSFLLAWWLLRYRGDALFLYGLGMTLIACLVAGIQAVRAVRSYPECGLDPQSWWKRDKVREVTLYCGWILFGIMGWLLRSHGITVLLNRMFPPLNFPHVNAAYAIGNQVSSQVQQLSASLHGAMTPEIAASEGRGDRGRVISYATRASKYSVFLLLFFAVPLLLEMDVVLKLWLVNPPQGAAFFCRIFIVAALIERSVSGEWMAICAKGQMALFQLVCGTTLLLTLPLTWLAFRLTGNLKAFAVPFLLISVATVVEYLWMARKLVGMPVMRWVRGVLLPNLLVVCVALCAGAGVQVLLREATLVRCVLVGLVSAGVTGVAGCFTVLDRDELRFFTEKIQRLAWIVRRA